MNLRVSLKKRLISSSVTKSEQTKKHHRSHGRKIHHPVFWAVLLSVLALGLQYPGVSQAKAGQLPEKASAGGTLKLIGQASGGSIDPQINYNEEYWEIFPLVYDGLVTFRQTQGNASFDIVPDLAVSVPKPTDGGLTYSFTLRRGIRFSNGEPVTVQAVKHSFIRIFKILSPNAGAWYSVIKGGQACMQNPATCTLPGIMINSKTNRIVFHLTHPDPSFLDQLSVPFAVILPLSTPDHDAGSTPLIGTGAYMFQSYSPQTGMVLVRNPYFRQWNAEAQPKGYPDKIIYNFGLDPNEQVTAVLNGEYDWMYGPIPLDRLPELAAAHMNQLHINNIGALIYAPMNVNIPPFNNLDARLAVNYAVNRKDIVKIMGGPALASPSCQFLPSGLPGYKPYCPYTENQKTTGNPDWAKAEYYMKKSGMIGQKVTVITYNKSPYNQIGLYLVSVLNSLGFKADVKMLSSAIEYSYIQNSANRVQMSVTRWYMDYPQPGDFLNILFGCGTFRPDSSSSPNISGFCDRAIQDKITKANRLSLTNKKASLALWAEIDRDVTDQAPAVSLVEPRHADLTSLRLHHFVFSKNVFFLPQLAQIN